MSRPQKMHKPLKFIFTEIINAVADGKGVAKPRGRKPAQGSIIKAHEVKPPGRQPRKSKSLTKGHHADTFKNLV